MKMSRIWVVCALLLGFLLGFMVGYHTVDEPYEILPEESDPPIVVEVIEIVKPEPVEPEPIEDPVEEEIKTYLGEFRVTAYCPCSECCGKWAKKRPLDDNGNPIVYGASGSELTAGYSIAVDPNVIPYGSIVEIDGKEYIAEDCGGSIEDNRIDLFFDSHQVALEWGVQYHDVYIVE